MKKLLSLLLILAFCCTVQAQSREVDSLLLLCKAEVTAINDMELCKTLVTYSGMEKSNNLSIVDYKFVDETVSFFYYDSQGKIRKYIGFSNYPEGSEYTIYYFDTGGFLVHTISYESWAMDWAMVGTRYTWKGKPIYANMQKNDDDGNCVEAEEKYGEDVFVGSNTYSALCHVDEIIERDEKMYNRTIAKGNDCKRVKFYQPTKGDKTIVNVRRANLRATPSTDGEIISVFGLGTESRILTVKERVGDWYSIRDEKGQEGYIFKDFLEPIEINITF